MTTAYRTPRAVVLHRTGVFYDNGHRHELSVSLGPDADLAVILAGAARALGTEGTVLLDMDLTTLQGTDRAGVADRWMFTELRRWTTLRDKTRPVGVLHLGLLGEMRTDSDAGPLLGGATGDPAELARRLGRYHELVGVPWRVTAGVTGCTALRARHTQPGAGRQPLWRSAGPRGMSGAGPLIWRRGRLPAEGETAKVHVWDVNAAYVGALRNARVGWGALEPSGAVGFDPQRAGWWEVSVADLPGEWLSGEVRPPVLPSNRIHPRHRSAWVTTETAKLLAEIMGSLDVLDSWTTSNAQTIARSLGERLGAARTGMLGPLDGVEKAIKRTYAELVGMTAREGGSIYRPDWAAAWIDCARANLMRRIIRTADGIGGDDWSGRWPLAVRTDAVYYLTDDPDTVGRLLGTGHGAGTLRYSGALTVNEFETKLYGGAHR